MTDNRHHFPGFDGLRLLAALSVAFSHSFLIAAGSHEGDLIGQWFGSNSLGLYGVYTFFIISGFLLAQSLSQKSGAVQFAINRILRIYPGLIFCVLVTVMLLGPIGSSLSWQQYFGDPSLVEYVKHTLSCLCVDNELPGVFAYQGGLLPKVVNGALWSLSYEVLSYLLLLLVWLTFRNISAVGVTFAMFGIWAMFSPSVAHDVIPGVAYTLPYFAGGVFVYIIYHWFGLGGWMAACCFAGLLLSVVFGVQSYAYAFLGAYLIAFLGNRPNVGSTVAGRAGDLSYGIYLFHWPVLQLVKQYSQTENPFLLMTVAAPFIVGAATVSYHLVERRALGLKKPLYRILQKQLAFRDLIEQRAAQFAATLAFLVAGTVILTSPEARWWFVTRSLVEIAAWSGIAAIVAVALVRLGRQHNLKILQATDLPEKDKL
jgi:peptidoglycan/LPS O-acetylase OafA/YrhL